jgi:hypothetical protein
VVDCELLILDAVRMPVGQICIELIGTGQKVGSLVKVFCPVSR